MVQIECCIKEGERMLKEVVVVGAVEVEQLARYVGFVGQE